jgi:hypothetical protein
MTERQYDFHPADAELARDALLREQEFAWSLVRSYREFQMQAVGFAIALDTTVLGLIGTVIDSTKLIKVTSYCTALLPFPTTLIVLAFAVMEVRIRRASRHSVRTISPKLEALRAARSSPPLLEWETSPSRHLTPFERTMANSTVFVAAISLPALGGAAWHLFSRAIPAVTWRPEITAVGAMLLIGAAILAASLSIGHESRH